MNNLNDSITSEDFDNETDLEWDQQPSPQTDPNADQDEDATSCADELWSYEVPRPWLSIEEAANMLGRSVRGMERSIIGRWGNKLPEGWQARRVRMDGTDQWRIVPPPGFRVKHSKKMDPPPGPLWPKWSMSA